MKNIFLPLIAIAMLFVGCAKENEQDLLSKAQTRVSDIQPISFSTKTLEFGSMEALNATISDLSDMTYEQREQWLSEHDSFVSMGAAAGQVNEQMRVCNSWDEVKGLQKEYADLFIFDPNTKVLNAAPFLKTDISGYQWVCNAYGDVTIGGAVVNLNNISTYAETWIAKAERESVLTRTTRATNMLTITSGAPYKRTTVAATLRKFNAYDNALCLQYRSQSQINDQWFIDEQDVFTIAYSFLYTNLSALNYYFMGYDAIEKNGAVHRTTTTPNEDNKEDVGLRGLGYRVQTGYTIYSRFQNNQGGDLVIDLP